MTANGKLLETLAHSAMFESYERAFTDTTGLPVALRPLETWQLPFHGKRRENAFCALMAGTSRACAACLQLQEKLAQAAIHGPATVTCAHGLCETAVPIKLGSQTIGFLESGQVMRRKPTSVSFGRAGRRARELGVDLRCRGVKAAYLKTPVVSRRRLDSVQGLLAIFADHLAPLRALRRRRGCKK